MKTVEECMALAEQAMLGGNFNLATFYHQRANLLARTRGDKARVIEELRKKLRDGGQSFSYGEYPYREVIETPTGFRVFVDNVKPVGVGDNTQYVPYRVERVLEVVLPFQKVGWEIDVKRYEYGEPGYVVCHSHLGPDVDTMYRGTYQICNRCLEVLPLVLGRKKDPGPAPEDQG